MARSSRHTGRRMRRSSVSLLALVLMPAAMRAQGAVDGKKVYATICLACHQASGAGVEEKYPPLDGSEWVADDAKMLRIILHGLTGPIEVAGQPFDAVMPPWGPTLKDAEVAAVATYVRSAWGNKSAAISPATVTAVRAANAARTTMWTAKELAQLPHAKP